MNYTLLIKVWVMLSGASTGNWCWNKDGAHAVELHNRTTSLILSMRTLVEGSYGYMSANLRLTTFGCAVLIQNHKVRRARRLENRSKLGVYLSAAYEHYRIHMPNTWRAEMSEIVTFGQAAYPFTSNHEAHYEMEEPALLDDTPQTSLMDTNCQLKECEVVRRTNKEKH